MKKTVVVTVAEVDSTVEVDSTEAVTAVVTETEIEIEAAGTEEIETKEDTRPPVWYKAREFRGLFCLNVFGAISGGRMLQMVKIDSNNPQHSCSGYNNELYSISAIFEHIAGFDLKPTILLAIFAKIASNYNS